MAKFRAEGNFVDYTPVADVVAGQLVKLGAFVGVADNAIPANKKGALRVTGIFSIPLTLVSGTNVIGDECDINFAGQGAVANGSGDASVKVFLAEDTPAVGGVEKLLYINRFGG